jgi:hypothetical protein
VTIGFVALWTVARLVVLVARPVAIDNHDAERAETAAILRSIRDEALAHPPGAQVVIENRPFAGFVLRNLFPGWAGVFVVFSRDDTVEGRPIRFAGEESDWNLAQMRGGRIADLVVRP